MGLTGKILCLLVLACLSSGACARVILLAAPATDSPLIVEFTNALSSELKQDEIRVIQTGSPAPAELAAADIIITLGAERLDWRLGQSLNTPSIALYISSSAIPAALPDYLHALPATPDPLRQVRLAKRLLPRLRTVGLLYSANSENLKQHWHEAIAANELQQHSVLVRSSDDLARDIQQVLDQSDVLLGIDDSDIYNADNLKTILLTSYSRNKVLIGPSAPFIEAGSLSTTYSSPQDMARSVALLLQRESLPSGTSYPAYFSVLSNAQVARSLGLPVPDDAELASELSKLEQTP
ncbi:ABC transporter substrate-binding protein [Halopseudomonas sp.]|uniref:ABC transporter substrate-binding protein n=1 Tax=Halopseudomonas sp. TaxID=2901191 RepID=UPI003001E59E